MSCGGGVGEVVRKAAEDQIVCYTAVFSVVTQGALRDDSKNGCVVD